MVLVSSLVPENILPFMLFSSFQCYTKVLESTIYVGQGGRLLTSSSSNTPISYSTVTMRDLEMIFDPNRDLVLVLSLPKHVPGYASLRREHRDELSALIERETAALMKWTGGVSVEDFLANGNERPKASAKIRMVVSSKQPSLSSPVFQAMLQVEAAKESPGISHNPCRTKVGATTIPSLIPTTHELSTLEVQGSGALDIIGSQLVIHISRLELPHFECNILQLS